MKFNLHGLFIAIASVLDVSKQKKLIEIHSVTAQADLPHRSLLQLFTAVTNLIKQRELVLNRVRLTPPTLHLARATKVRSQILYISLRFPLFRPRSVSLASLCSSTRHVLCKLEWRASQPSTTADSLSFLLLQLKHAGISSTGSYQCS